MRGSLITRRYPLGEHHAMVIHADGSRTLGLVDFAPLPAGADGCEPCAELFVLSGKTPARRPPGSIAMSDSGGIREYRRNEVYFTDWFGKAQALMSPATLRAVVTVPRARRLNPEFLSRLVIRPVLDRLLERSFLLLHAAGAAHEGSAVILAGRAGSGKTTLLEELLDAGMEFLADDRMIAGTGGRCSVFRFPEHIRRSKMSRGPKHRRIPSRHGPIQASPSCILILERGGDALKVTPLSPAETAARLIRHVTVRDPGLWERNTGAVAALCGQSRGFMLQGWGTAGERLKMALDLVDSGGGAI